MKLIFEKSKPGRTAFPMPPCDVPNEFEKLSSGEKREEKARLPEVSEVELVRHYIALSRRAFGVDNGFYPLGSCTMKYNPKINEKMASLKEFTNVHPLQSECTIQGSLELLYTLEQSLAEVTGMDSVSLSPGAGAQGEWTGLLLIKKYHESRGDTKRTKILVPESAHGTNPASATMAGFTVVEVPDDENGNVNIEKLKELAGDDTAALMLTNPNTLGLFEKNITIISDLIHDVGGLLYYDGANLNAVMGVVRPGDMGFDVVHLNLHKTFATPHGGGGPGTGPVGCKAILTPFLPKPTIKFEDGKYSFENKETSIGSVKVFYGNFLVLIKAYTYIVTLGGKGITEAAQNAVLNANYLMNGIYEIYGQKAKDVCMHEFVLSCEDLKKKTGVNALDVAKAMLDYGIHPPTMYFPLNVPEALMFEPTETESKETLDECIEVHRSIYARALKEPEAFHNLPETTVVSRPDEVRAARTPVIRYQF